MHWIPHNLKKIKCQIMYHKVWGVISNGNTDFAVPLYLHQLFKFWKRRDDYGMYRA